MATLPGVVKHLFQRLPRTGEPVRLRMSGQHCGRGAFSLTELLVVIAIIALLLGLLIGPLAQARKNAWNTRCLIQLRDLSLVTTLYAAEYKALPVVGTIGPVPHLALPGPSWNCPADREMPKWTLDSSYAYLASLYMGPNADVTRPHTLRPWMALRAYYNNPKLPLFYDIAPWHGHRNVANFDGAVGEWGK